MRWAAAAVSRNWLFHTKISTRVGLGEEDHTFRSQCRLHALTCGLSSGNALSGLPVGHRVAVESGAGRQILSAPSEKGPSCSYLSAENDHLSPLAPMHRPIHSRPRSEDPLCSWKLPYSPSSIGGRTEPFGEVRLRESGLSGHVSLDFLLSSRDSAGRIS